MISDIILQAQDYSFETGSDPNLAQIVVAALVILMLFLFVVIYYQRQLKQGGRDEEHVEHKQQLNGQLEDSDPIGSTYLFRGDDEDERANRVERIFTEDERAAGFLDAIKKTLSIPFNALPDVPRLVIRLASESILVAVLGAMVFYSVDVWQNFIDGGDVSFSLGTIIEYLGELVDGAITVLQAYPFYEVIYALALSVFLNIGVFLYQHWVELAFTLALGAAAIYLAHRRLGDTVTVSDVTPTYRILLTAGGIVVVTILVGAGVHTGARLALSDSLSSIVALAASLLVALGLSLYNLRNFFTRLSTLLNENKGSRGQLLGYLSARALLTALSIATIPIILAYFVTVAVDGTLVTILGLIFAASLPAKALTGVIAVLLLVIILVRARETVAEALRLWSQAAAVRAIKIIAYEKLFPFVAALILSLLAIQIAGETAIDDAVVALVTMFIAFFVFRGAYYYYRRIKYKTYSFGGDTDVSPPRRMLVEIYELEDAAGEPVYVARLRASHWLAHRDSDDLVDAVLRDANHRFTEDEWRQSVESVYWTKYASEGIVEMEYVANAMRKEVRRRVMGNLRRQGGDYKESKLRENITEDYPASTYDEIKRDLLRNGRVGERADGDVLVIKRDEPSRLLD